MIMLRRCPLQSGLDLVRVEVVRLKIITLPRAAQGSDGEADRLELPEPPHALVRLLHSRVERRRLRALAFPLCRAWRRPNVCLCAAAAETQHFVSPNLSLRGCLGALHDLQREEQHLSACRQIISSRHPDELLVLALPGRLKVSSCTHASAQSVGRVVFTIALGACFSGLGGGSTRPLRSDSLAGAFRDGLCALCMVAEASAQKQGCLQLFCK